ncbi:MAG: PAS domain S-box protein, partial [Bacillota bacterium]
MHNLTHNNRKTTITIILVILFEIFITIIIHSHNSYIDRLPVTTRGFLLAGIYFVTVIFASKVYRKKVVIIALILAITNFLSYYFQNEFLTFDTMIIFLLGDFIFLLISYSIGSIAEKGKKYVDELHFQNEEIERQSVVLAIANKELTQAKDILMLNEEKYRLLYSSMSQGLALHEIITDDSGKPIDYVFVDINDSYEELFGIRREDVIGKRFTEVMPKEEPHWIEILGKVALTGIPMEYESYLEATGKHYSIYAYCTRPRRFAVLVTDVSEHKQIVEQLEQKEKNLLESQRIAHLGSWRLNVVTNEVVWTEELYKMYGFDPTIPPLDYTENMKLFTPESWKKLSSSLALTSSRGIPYELELETVKKDGTNGWMWVRGEAEKDDKGDIVAIFGTAQDITERIRNLNFLKKIEQNLKLAQRIAHLGSWELDLSTGRVWGSEEAFNIYDLDRTSEFLDYDVTQNMVDDEDKEKKDKAFNGLLNERKPYDVTFKLHTGKGVIKFIKYINSKASLFTDSENKPVKVFGTIHDITESIIVNKELEESEQRLSLFFNQSLTGFFIIEIEEPIYWNDEVNKEEVLDYIFRHQKCTR